MIAWALTYALHSTALILLAGAVARLPWARQPRVQLAIWKAALLGALVTATLHQATGGLASLAPPIPMPASPAAALHAPAGHGWPWGAIVWSAIAGLAAARLISGWRRLRRQTGRRRVLASGPLRRELDAILASAGVTRRLVLTCSRGLAVPRAIGTREICVPIRALRDLTPAERRALLAHETAHLLRRDGVWLLGAAVVQTLTWWQPLTRLAVARLRQAMELCCDDWAAARLPDRMALAACLVKVGEWVVAAPAGLPLAAFTSRGSTLRERVERLMTDEIPGPATPRAPWLAAMPVLVVFAFAPRVIVAETSMIPALAAPTLLHTGVRVSAAPDAPAVQLTPASSARRAKRRLLPSSAPALSTDLPQVIATVEPASAGAGQTVPPAPASDAPPVIAMPEPLPMRAPGLRGIGRAVSAAARNPPAKPDLHVAQDPLERRIGLWLEWQRRSPFTTDPLRPKHPQPEGRSYLSR